MKKLLLFLCLPLALPVAVSANERVDIGLFSQQDTTAWQKKQFDGDTDYRIVSNNAGFVLEAESQNGATAYFREIEVDLIKTPFLNWNWQKVMGINPGDETEKSGDDFVARIYVIKDGGLWFWKTKAINYVWSHSHQKQQVWNNPFAGKNAQMLAQRDASDTELQWFAEKRNVREDFIRLFGQAIDKIDGIAIMTDSDNSGLHAKALYGDIYFSAN